MLIEISKSTLNDPIKALELEWIDTNALGGYASSSIIGCNTRSYHGLLVAAIPPPANRYVVLSRLDESISIAEQTVHLSTRDFGDTLYPQGFNFLTSYKQSISPVWEYQISDIRIKKTLVCIKDSNSVCLKYELFSGLSNKIPLSFEPFVAARSYHARQHDNSNLKVISALENNRLSLNCGGELPAFQIIGPWTEYNHAPCWHKNFYYREEARRGLGDREDLLCTGKLECILSQDNPVYIYIGYDSLELSSIPELLESELQRRQTIIESGIQSRPSTQAPKPSFLKSIFGRKDNKSTRSEEDISGELHQQLTSVAEQFITKRGQGLTIIAGYHWFTDWGRDTLIALRGLCLATKKLDQAQAILGVFCANIKNGLVPNRFVETGEEAEYNTVDASLWLFIASYEFLEAGGDKTFTKNILFPALKNIFEFYSTGTLYQIKEDTDGLISAGDQSIQLTWMDAKIGDWVVTPRHGKAVEINALWFNALNILKIFAERFSDTELSLLLTDKIKITKNSFELLFWNDSLDCLYDVVRSDFSDASIRPNQIFAIGLPFPLLNQQKSLSVLRTIKDHLLTKRGLRTLSRQDKSYRPTCDGNPYDRDSSYHQGTVWPWLLGVYIDALLMHDSENGNKQISEILADMHSHLFEAGLGSISEIFDGSEPNTPRGTISQAWSVSELLRVCIKLKE